MEIYTKKDFNHGETILENVKDLQPLFQTDETIEFGQPFSYKGKNYMACMHDLENDILIVDSFELKKISKYEYEYSDEIMCPYCGDIQCDSWEADESGKERCEVCGGVYEYTREVAVSYSSSKVESPQIKVVK